MTHTPQPSVSAARRFAEDTLQRIDGAHAVVVATVDGFALAHASRREVDVERLSAMLSSLAALGAAASRETGIGFVRVLVIESTAGRIVTRCLDGSEIVIAVLADTQVPLGLVWTQLRHAESQLVAA